MKCLHKVLQLHVAELRLTSGRGSTSHPPPVRSLGLHYVTCWPWAREGGDSLTGWASLQPFEAREVDGRGALSSLFYGKGKDPNSRGRQA